MLVGFAVLDGLKYASSHEWVKHDGPVATVGITDHAQVPSLFSSSKHQFNSHETDHFPNNVTRVWSINPGFCLFSL